MRKSVRMKKTKKQPKTVYVNGINMYGFWHRSPSRYKYDDLRCVWYNEKEDRDICQLGIEQADTYVSYSSVNKEDVELWMQGAQAVMHLLKNLSG